MPRPKMFRVTEAHGRVKRDLGNGRRTLVAIPGQEIPWELAEELGLVEPSEPEATVPEPQTQPERPFTPAPGPTEPPKPARKAPAKKSASKKAAPNLSSYPTKKSAG